MNSNIYGTYFVKSNLVFVKTFVLVKRKWEQSIDIRVVVIGWVYFHPCAKELKYSIVLLSEYFCFTMSSTANMFFKPFLLRKKQQRNESEK